MASRIDWDEMVSGYNRIKKKDCKDTAEMFEDLFTTHTREEASTVLGVSTDTITRKVRVIREANALLLPGNRFTIKKRFQQIPPEKMAQMTKLEIAVELGCADKYVGILAKEFKRDFIRVLNGGIYYAEKARAKKRMSL
jgi:hypothetical protein